VYNGGGIYPDVEVAATKLSPITISLIKVKVCFRFANAYKRNMLPQVEVRRQFSGIGRRHVAFVTRSSLDDKDYAYIPTTRKAVVTILELKPKRAKSWLRLKRSGRIKS